MCASHYLKPIWKIRTKVLPFVCKYGINNSFKQIMARKKKVSDIDSKLEEVKSQIKANSKDAHFAEALIEELLSLKGQKDHQPMYLCVPEKEVVKTYDFGAFSISNCKGGILFHAKGGLDTYVTPRMRALYDHLALLVSMKEEYAELSEESLKAYNTLFATITTLLMTPIMAPITAKGLVDTSNAVVEIFDREAKILANQPLMEEDYHANAEFDNMIAATEVLKKMGKDEQ